MDGPPCVLVIWNDDSFLPPFREMLRGYRTFVAANENQALDILRNEDVDCVVIDMEITGDGGMGLLTLLQDIDALIPVIAVSAEGTKTRIKEYFEAGAFDYLMKPVSGARIQQAIPCALRYRETRRQAFGDALHREIADFVKSTVETTVKSGANLEKALKTFKREYIKKILTGKGRKKKGADGKDGTGD